jgi:hypothetical protein
VGDRAAGEAAAIGRDAHGPAVGDRDARRHRLPAAAKG